MADSKADNKFEQVVHMFEPQSKLLRRWELKGGVSAQVTALEIERPDGRTKKMSVRQHGEVDLRHNPHIAADEFELLHVLHYIGLAVPTPYYLDLSCEIFPTPYIVIEYIEGEPIFGDSDVAVHLDQGDASLTHTSQGSRICAAQPDQGDASVPTHHPHSPRPYATVHSNLRFEAEPVAGLIYQLATQLSRIHKVDYSNLDVSFLPQHENKVAIGIRKRPVKVDEAFDESHIRDVLEVVWPLPQRNTSVLLHGDFWPGNILWRDGQIVGVIDWEDAALGDPLADVANSRLEVLWAFGIDAMQSFTHHYQSMTAIDFTNLPYWDLSSALRRISQIGEWGLDEATEQLLQERLRWFIAQAFIYL